MPRPTRTATAPDVPRAEAPRTARVTSASSSPSMRASTRTYPGRSAGSRISATTGAAARSAPTRPSTVARSKPASAVAITNSNIGVRVSMSARTAPSPRCEAQVARVEPVGRDGDVGLGGEALLVGEGAQRRLLAGGIAVEREDDLARRRSRRPSRAAAP